MAGDSSTDDRFTQTDHICHNNTIVLADSLYTDTHRVLLVFEVDEIAVGYLVRCEYLLRVIQVEVFVQNAQIEQIRRRCLLVPDMLEHTILEVLDARLIYNRRSVFP